MTPFEQKKILQEAAATQLTILLKEKYQTWRGLAMDAQTAHPDPIRAAYSSGRADTLEELIDLLNSNRKEYGSNS